MSCSEPTIETISSYDAAQDSADKPVSNCCEGIDEVPVAHEAAGHDSSTKNPNEEAPVLSKSSTVEEEDTLLMACDHVETTQNISNVQCEDAEGMSLEDRRSSHSLDFRHQVAVKRRTAIVTRLDGVDLSTGSEVSFYKCHLCGMLFGRLTDVPMHLSLHSPQRMTLYQCLLCEGSFSFKTKLMQHLRIRHNVKLPGRGENSVTDGFSVSSKDLLDPSGVASSSDCGQRNIPQRNGKFLQSNAGCVLRAATKSPTGLEIGASRSSETSGGLQFELPNLSVEDSNRIPGDELILGKIGFDKLSDGRNGLFRCDPVKGLTKTNSFLCQMCGFESWRQNRLLHHVIKHHFDLAAVQKMRRQLLHRRKLQLPHRTSDDSLRRTFGNDRELKTVSSLTGNCLTSSAAESQTISSATLIVECKEEPLSFDLSPKTANHLCEHNDLYDNSLMVRSDPVLYNTTDVQDSPKKSYSDMSESFHMTDQIKKERLLMTPASPMSTEQLRASDNKAVNSGCSLISMHPSSSISCDMQPDATIPTSSSLTTISSLIAAHETGSECKPLIFTPNNISPLIHGFLPLPLLSLLVSQSNLNPASFLGKSNLSSSQFTSEQVSQQSLNEKLSASHASNSWNEREQFEASKAEDVKPSRAVLDWRVMMRNRTKGGASRGSSTLNTRFNAGNELDQDIETLKPIITPDGQAVYRCTYCNKDFSTASDVTRHMEFHEDIRPYRCTHCDYHARTNSQLKVHMMRHQGIRKFQCRLCNYKGVTQSDLNRHAKSQIHMLKARNQCESCGEGFVSPINLRKHFHERHFGQKANPDLDHRQ